MDPTQENKEAFEKAEIDFLTRDRPPLMDHGNTNNMVIESDRVYQMLCASLEMKGFKVEGKTVAQFEGAIEALNIKHEEEKKSHARSKSR